jgi:sortase A
MKKLTILLIALAVAITQAIAVPAIAADYSFASGGDTVAGFGKPTGYDEPAMPIQLNANARRNKDAAYFPPPYGVGSGDIPTELSSIYHDSMVAGTADANRASVAISSGLPNSMGASVGMLPSTSLTLELNTAPLYYGDGSIGTLYVARTKKTIKVYEGEDLANLVKGAGHFASTSCWDGNVALAGHNRGSHAYFSFVKDLRKGDTLTYTTKYGVRKYKVFSKTQVNELDSSSLSWSAENILTLITCIANVPELRYCVQAREVE